MLKTAYDEEIRTMKAGIHPNYQPTVIKCACGATIETGSGITEDLASKFKASKFYTEIFQKHNDEVIIGVRDGYICLYYNCDCIAKIEPAETLTAKTYFSVAHPILTWRFTLTCPMTQATKERMRNLSLSLTTLSRLLSAV